MNTEGSKQPPAPAPIPAARDNTVRSGEGASTALEALIRKRKQAETPDDHLPPAPLQR